MVRLNRSPGKVPWAVWMRETRAWITPGDWPASMSKSTPMSPEEAQRPTNVAKPASVPQVKEPAAPPVEMMYLTPDAASAGTFADAIAAP